MLFQSYLPAPPLSHFVEKFWFYHGFPQRTHKKERLMPDGSVELVINLHEDETRIYDRDRLHQSQRLSGNILCGPHSQFFVIDTAEQASVIGIHFRPGGAFPFFRQPVDEMHNFHVSLEDLWGGHARLVREKLLEAPTPEQKFRVLERFVMEQARTFDRHVAVSFALKQFESTHGALPVGDVIERIGISQRRLIDLFNAQVGMTPKLFCRLRRFQHVLNQVHPLQECDWGELAALCGYFDQAHFIHDFRQFSGILPTEYLTIKTEYLNHVPILD